MQTVCAPFLYNKASAGLVDRNPFSLVLGELMGGDGDSGDPEQPLADGVTELSGNTLKSPVLEEPTMVDEEAGDADPVLAEISAGAIEKPIVETDADAYEKTLESPVLEDAANVYTKLDDARSVSTAQADVMCMTGTQSL